VRRKSKPTALPEPILLEDIENLVAQCESNPFLLESSHLRDRFDALDRLDVLLGDQDASSFAPSAINPGAFRRAQLLRQRLEAINADLCHTIRAEVQQGGRPALLMRLLNEAAEPAPGLSFDYLDEFLSGVLALEPPDPPPAHPPDGMVFYQPTPARQILHLLRLVALTASDVFLDLGSGLGHVSLLASICTGASCIGIEREEAYVTLARRCAYQLNLGRLSFLQQDARQADPSRGTVFYLYTPFAGAILADVLHRLRQESKSRPIRICTFGPCTETVANEKWLQSDATPDPDHITLFRSRA
jgi:hypothetical protein